ncbi:MAG: PAS domain S-box protein [Chlorobiaceae bacterium]|nr:PAS domain S-box protein [Chlorobiaceae bacterium]
MDTQQGEVPQLRRELEAAQKRISELEQELKRERGTLKAVFDLTPDFFVMKDRNSTYRAVNPAFCKFLGKSEEEIVGKGDFELFPPEDAVLYVQGDARVMETGKVETEDWSVAGSAGRVWLQVIKSPVLDESGSVSGVLCSVRDISRRKKAELELEQFFVLIPDMACIVSTGGFFVKVNKAWEKSLGYTPQELITIPFLDLIHPDDKVATSRTMERQLAGGEVRNFLNRYRAKDGSYRWFEWNSAKLNGDAICAIARDVTTRIEQEQETRLWADAFRYCAHGIAIGLPLTNTILTCNEAFARMQAMKVSEIEGLPILSMYVSEDRNQVVERIHECDQKGFVRYEARMVRKNGSTYPVQMDVVSVSDPDGHLLYRIATMQDISERQRTQKELFESEERFRSVVESAPEGIFIQTKGCFSYLNHMALVMFGASSIEEMAGRTVLTSIHPDFRAIVAERIRLLNEDRLSVPALEEKMLRLDGTTFEAELSAVPFIYSGQSGALVFMRDITDRKKAEADKGALERQLFRSQKMESIGRLAGGVAHDLNNLLTPILGYSEMLFKAFPPEDRRSQYLTVMHEAALKARDLIRQLLAFSSTQKLEFRAVDLNSVVKGFEHLLRRTLRANVEIRYTLHEESLPMLGDSGQLEQIILNLAINAADSMPSGGLLSMVTRQERIEAEEAETGTEGIPQGRYAVLEVRDTGSGMDSDTLAHVFEPFFTTKAKGKGTGLGLSTVYGIVRQHGGFIRVSSAPGKGSSFRILFPLLEGSVTAESSVEEHKLENGKHAGIILVVEDDEIVRKFVVQTLAQQGYQVHDAAGGEEAIELLSKADFTPDLLLTDLVMRGINGKELFDRLKTMLPTLRVVYMSGYTKNIISNHGVLSEGTEFLQKPFTLNALVERVKMVMQKS